MLISNAILLFCIGGLCLWEQWFRQIGFFQRGESFIVAWNCAHTNLSLGIQYITLTEAAQDHLLKLFRLVVALNLDQFQSIKVHLKCYNWNSKLILQISNLLFYFAWDQEEISLCLKWPFYWVQKICFGKKGLIAKKKI